MEILITEEVEAFLHSLEEYTSAKFLRTLDLLERFGYRLGPPYCKKIGADLFELRIRGQQDVRVFFTFRNDRAVLFYGFKKKTNKIPVKHLKNALRRLHRIT